MKKYFILLLLLVYGLSSTGMSVHLHYCCGKLDDITFSAQHQKGCAKDSLVKTKKDRCCSNQQIELKLKVDQEPATQWVQGQQWVAAPILEALPLTFFIPLHQPVFERATGPPEAITSLPLFIKNCVFRI